MDVKGNFIFSVLDIANDRDTFAYERALYRAFASSTNLDRIWDTDHTTRRIVTKIPYESQKIYVAKTGERIVAAAAINFEVASPFQLEFEGFSIDKSAPGACEILQMFCLLDVLSSASLLKSFTKFFLERMIAGGAKKMYGTCSERRVLAVPDGWPASN